MESQKKSNLKLGLRFAKEIFKDESGQATTEYILMIAIVMGFLVLVIQKFIKPVYARLATNISRNIERQLFSADLHTFRMGRM